VLEAMAMRLPIVAPNLDGIGEILENGESALLVNPPVCDGFVAALARLFAEPALSEGLAAAAEAKVRARFSAKAMATQVEAIYERCLEGSGSSAE